MLISLYLVFNAVVVALCLLMALPLQKRKQPEGRSLVWCLIVVIAISVCFSLMLFADSPFLYDLGFVGKSIGYCILMPCVFCTLFLICEIKSKIYLYIVNILCTIMLVLWIISPLTGMFYEIKHCPDTGLAYIEISQLYFIHYIWIFLLGLLLLGMLIYKVVTTKWIYKIPFLITLVICIMIFVASLVYEAVQGEGVYCFQNLFLLLLLIWLYLFIYYFRFFLMTGAARFAGTDRLNIAIVMFDDRNKLIDANEEARNLFGIVREDLNNYSLQRFVEEKLNQDADDFADSDNETVVTFNIDEKETIYSVSYINNKNAKGEVLIKIFVCEDVTDIKMAADKINELQTTDEKTGFYSREEFFKYINRLEKEKVTPVTVAVYNTNGFKLYNDLFGREEGDRVLEETADIVRSIVPEGTFVARFDGDDTGIVFVGIEESKVIEIMDKLKDAFKEYFRRTNKGLTIEFGLFTNMLKGGSLEEAYKIARNSMNKKKMMESESSKSALLNALMSAISQRDIETHRHEERSRNLAQILGKEMHLTYSEMGDLELLAVLHDIGKITIADKILLKPSKLNEDEWEIMKQHAEKGYYIANASQELSSIAMGILCHHERWDGKGYPNGIKGEEIPLISRVVSVIDSFDVMTHERPYKKAMSMEEAVKELISCRGTQFDPQVVDCFVEAIETGKIRIEED